MSRQRDFRIDSEVYPMESSGSRYRASIPDAWRAVAAFGGMVVGLAHRAAQRAVDRPSLSPLYISASFFAPVPCESDLELEANVSSNTLNSAHASVDLYVSGKKHPRMRLSAVFGRRIPHPYILKESKFPEGLLSPERALPVQQSTLGDMPILDQFELRWAQDGSTHANLAALPPSTSTERAATCAWWRFRRSPLVEDGCLDPLALALPADALASAMFRGLQISTPSFVPLTLAMDLHFLRSTRRSWLLQHARVVDMADGYASGIVEIWDEDRVLLAVGTQLRVCSDNDRAPRSTRHRKTLLRNGST
jgi:acyl-CoA thioesterase